MAVLSAILGSSRLPIMETEATSGRLEGSMATHYSCRCFGKLAMLALWVGSEMVA